MTTTYCPKDADPCPANEGYGCTGHDVSSINDGLASEPLAQGYELVMDYVNPTNAWDPFGNGTRIYACPECGATWNADDLHLSDCARRED